MGRVYETDSRVVESIDEGAHASTRALERTGSRRRLAEALIGRDTLRLPAVEVLRRVGALI